MCRVSSSKIQKIENNVRGFSLTQEDAGGKVDPFLPSMNRVGSGVIYYSKCYCCVWAGRREAASEQCNDDDDEILF